MTSFWTKRNQESDTEHFTNKLSSLENLIVFTHFYFASEVKIYIPKGRVTWSKFNHKLTWIVWTVNFLLQFPISDSCFSDKSLLTMNKESHFLFRKIPWNIYSSHSFASTELVYIFDYVSCGIDINYQIITCRGNRSKYLTKKQHLYFIFVCRRWTIINLNIK